MQKKKKHSPELLAAAAKVTTKRGKIFITHLLKHGEVSTEELEVVYKLMDAASAARDVKDAGVPLSTRRAKRANGRQMVVYSFSDPSLIRGVRFRRPSRTHWPKAVASSVPCLRLHTSYPISRSTTEFHIRLPEKTRMASVIVLNTCYSVDRASAPSRGPLNIATIGEREDSQAYATHAIGLFQKSTRISR